MRKEPFITGHYYHVYNRGVDKRDITVERADSDRFELSLELFALKKPIRSIRDFQELPDVRRLEMMGDEKLVSMVEYCLNPNHFHLLMKQEVDGGISEFMKRLQGGYTKYFNEKHERSGALLQGKFKSVLTEKENYFEILCAYVMWNNSMHNIPHNKKYLIRSSLNEYKSNNFSIVSAKEAKKMLDFFRGYKNLEKHAREIIFILRAGRGKGELDDELFPDVGRLGTRQT